MRASISVAIAGLLCVNGIGSATAQSDTSANSVFLGCKALVEDRAPTGSADDRPNLDNNKPNTTPAAQLRLQSEGVSD
jgi:hypothetical protein